MSDKFNSSEKMQSSTDKDLSRRKFLARAASQIALHSLVTVPTVALVLNGAAIPANAQSAYGLRNRNPNANNNNRNNNPNRNQNRPR